MSPDERHGLADRLLAEHIYRVDYERGSTALLAVLPILYGTLTWIFGPELWGGSRVYETALQVPYAPQSWGSVFILLGGSLFVAAWRDKHKWCGLISITLAGVLSMFMVSFAMEWFGNRSNESALPPALIYAVFSLLFLNRWRFAAKMRILEQTYQDN